MKNEIISVKQFNENQQKKYADYCQKCINNGVKPFHISRYFYICPIKYGYIYENNFGEIFWAKTKKQLKTRLNHD